MDIQQVDTAGVHPPLRFQPRRNQKGFSILEVMIAVIILSIGMLGAVGMQASAMQSNKETRNSAVATTFARELAEKMRGNHTVAIEDPAKGFVNPYIFEVTLPKDAVVTAPSRNCFTHADGCPLVQDAASWDVADWQSRVQLALPTPKIKVCFDTDPFDTDGKARWACTDDGDVAVLKMSWTRNSTAGTLLFADGDVPALIVPLTAGSK